ncbi:MAG: transglycosylase SLT domain-containing protein [Thiogranum sp.]
MQNNNESHKAQAGKEQQALQYALEREQWSSDLQQQCKDRYRAELEQLQQQLAETRARHETAVQALQRARTERDSAQQQIEELRSSLADTAARLEEARQTANTVVTEPPSAAAHDNCALKRVTAAAVSILALGTLFTTIAFHDAQSNVENKPEPEIAAVGALENTRVVNRKTEAGAEKGPQPQTRKGKTRFARLKNVSQQQWGPPLLMTDTGGAKPRVTFDPLIKELQENLLTLGFDIGEADGFNGTRTRQAITEFRALYIQDSGKQIPDTGLAIIIKNYAGLARADADRFGIDHGVVAAIRLSSVRTGVDFSYLMKLAAAESNFEPASKSGSSSATGMYQFTRDTWLNTLARHGAKYGLADYTTKIGFYITTSGVKRPRVQDKAVYRHLLELRKNPRIASMMVAESVLDNRKKLAHLFDREPAQTDLYLTHFLGATGAIAFLKALDENPDTPAVDMFPAAARSNYGIFHPENSNPRTVDEVYALFGKKFSARHYGDLAVN